MAPKYLLDTNVVLRWLVEPRKLSKEQRRLLTATVARNEPVAVSTVTILEIAVLLGDSAKSVRGGVEELLGALETDPAFRVLPITAEIGREVCAIGSSLRDPADRAIVATARVHGLKLVTSDQRIVESGLAVVVE